MVIHSAQSTTSVAVVHALEVVLAGSSESVAIGDSSEPIAEQPQMADDRESSTHKLVEAPTESTFSTVLKPQPKKGEKRAHIPDLLASLVGHSHTRQRAAAQIASLQIRPITESDRTPRHHASSSTGLVEPAPAPRGELELSTSPIPQSIDLTASTPASTISSASVASTTASTSSTARPSTSYVEEIHYVDAERVFSPQAAANEFQQLPSSSRPGPDPSSFWPEVDSRNMQSIFNDFKNG